MLLTDPEVESSLLISLDEGASYQKHSLAFDILSLLFHPEQEDWILAYSHDQKVECVCVCVAVRWRGIAGIKTEYVTDRIKESLGGNKGCCIWFTCWWWGLCPLCQIDGLLDYSSPAFRVTTHIISLETDTTHRFLARTRALLLMMMVITSRDICHLPQGGRCQHPRQLITCSHKQVMRSGCGAKLCPREHKQCQQVRHTQTTQKLPHTHRHTHTLHYSVWAPRCLPQSTPHTSLGLPGPRIGRLDFPREKQSRSEKWSKWCRGGRMKAFVESQSMGQNKEAGEEFTCWSVSMSL